MEDNYNIVMVFAIHQHESATVIHVSPHPEAPFLLPPHPLGCPRAPALGALLHALNLHWFEARLENYGLEHSRTSSLEQHFSSTHMHTRPLCISLKCRCLQVGVCGWETSILTCFQVRPRPSREPLMVQLGSTSEWCLFFLPPPPLLLLLLLLKKSNSPSVEKDFFFLDEYKNKLGP